ncbi:MAG: extracellular solute-binding protein [Candidatus Sumerlaeota bacterium]|nr:extracellular solute-binding protein [Candidatus Sumerlaeota bacterium]
MKRPLLFCSCLLLLARIAAAAPLELRAWGVPDVGKSDVDTLATLAILDEFQKKFPDIRPVSNIGLYIPSLALDVAPLMQIAGDIPAHVMYVNFRQSDTYIRNKFLYPLDKYVEQTAGLSGGIPGGPSLELDEYVSRLRQGARFDQEIAQRVPDQCWWVMRRECPYGAGCTYLKAWGEPPSEQHYHTWCFPVEPVVSALFYRKDMFHDAGLPDRVPRNVEEFYDFAKQLTNPRENRYGLMVVTSEMSYTTLNFLYSYGGLLVDRDAKGQWRCVFDSDQAVDAYYYVARLFLAPFRNAHGEFSEVTYKSGAVAGDLNVNYAMFFAYIDEQFFGRYDPAQWSFGPVPAGPDGYRSSELNARMTGIYAGLDTDKALRDAAWEYIRFYDGPEARRIRAKVFVENGFGRYVRPPVLVEAGYPELVKQVPPGWEEAYQSILRASTPEPYGTNCQKVYRYASKAIDQFLNDSEVKEAVRAGRADRAKARIRAILQERVAEGNAKMLDLRPPEERRVRNRVAAATVVLIILIFAAVFTHVIRVFSEDRERLESRSRGSWEFSRFKWAYILMLPALASIGLWAYYPLSRGATMAFLQYNVRGFSQWIGMDNFANVIFDPEFWYSILTSFKWAVYYMLFGFCMPILLALLLTEIPRGRLTFRMIYYLPAVLSGVVVIFLWKGFYGSYGLINELCNLVIGGINRLTGAHLSEVSIDWLSTPQFALFFCLLPTIWAGMGPGCLIYLAALKTIPEELYEAADIDGAGVWAKVRHVTLPGIKGLILINFVGVMVAHLKSGGEYVLAMTGGGPYTPFGQTELIGLHIFWEAFAYLRFGTATSMAWILGSMLIGFTVIQLKRLSRMEFRAAAGVER